MKCACFASSKDDLSQVLLLGVGDMLLAHTCGQPQSSVRTMHHAYQQVVTSLDSRCHSVGAAIRDHSTLNSNYYVSDDVVAILSVTVSDIFPFPVIFFVNWEISRYFR